MTITVDSMRSQLLSVDAARDLLAASEPLTAIPFSAGDKVRFFVDEGWHHGFEAKAPGDLIDARIAFGPILNLTEYQLTKAAFLEATALCGLGKPYVLRSPGSLNEINLNHWFRIDFVHRRGAPKDFQLLLSAGRAAAITRATVNPVSNVRMLDSVLAGIGGRGEVLVDYKLAHSLKATHMRLVLPEHGRRILGTGTEDDQWSVGIQFKNALHSRPILDGYLFRWVCTNGQIDTRVTTGAWTRTKGGDPDDVYTWAREAVDGILGGLESSLDAVQGTVGVTFEGNVSDALRDLFARYRVPPAERTRIIEALVNSGREITMYEVMAAITQLANDRSLDPSQVETLMRIGGDLPHKSSCDACHQLLPH